MRLRPCWRLRLALSPNGEKTYQKPANGSYAYSSPSGFEKKMPAPKRSPHPSSNNLALKQRAQQHERLHLSSPPWHQCPRQGAKEAQEGSGAPIKYSNKRVLNAAGKWQAYLEPARNSIVIESREQAQASNDKQRALRGGCRELGRLRSRKARVDCCKPWRYA